MTKQEYQNCQWAANLYHDKVRECEILKKRLEQKERENRILKERLRYKTAIDIQRSREDAEVFNLVKCRNIIVL